jgi:dolichyl-phosphate-mannose-protein mannosyltransferase
MACAWGSKVNGILTVIAVGIAVLIDLWDVLDHKKEGHTMVSRTSSLSQQSSSLLQEYFWRHFTARAIGLIAVPFLIYLSFFYVHFAVLVRSGPGDAFMSPAFQETLVGNDMLLNSRGWWISACFSFDDTQEMRRNSLL